MVAKKKKLDSKTVVQQIYSEYIPFTGNNVWPWEKLRWYEMVFCILYTIGEPEILPVTARHVTNTLSEYELINIDNFGKLNIPEDNSSSKVYDTKKMDISEIPINKLFTIDPLYITIDTLLRQAGYTPKKSKIAIKTIAKLANAIRGKYNGKVQNYLGKYGHHMLSHIDEDFGFNDSETKNAISLWLQNVTNMPVPVSTSIIDQTCKNLGFKYEVLVKEANQQDINIALFDDALRYYWETHLKK